jgi:hypothetical protein
VRSAILFLSACLPAFGAAFTASVTGDWSSSATWGGAGVPGIGDTATVNSGITVTVPASTAVTFGTSPAAANTVVLALGTGGHIRLLAGSTFHIRGAASTGTGTDIAAQVDGGATWDWDSSVSGIGYQWVQPVFAFRRFQAVGSATDCTYNQYTRLWSGSTCAVVTSTTSGKGAGFGNQDGFYQGGFTVDYAAVSNLGSASVPAFYARNNSTPTPQIWITHTSIANSGRIEATANADLKLQAYSGIGCLDFDVIVSDGASFITRAMNGNAFCRAPKIINGLTWNLSQNIWNENPTLASASGMSSSTFTGSIINPGNSAGVTFPFDMSWSMLYWNNTAQDNPHGICNSSDRTVSYVAWESPDNFTSDSGESILQNCGAAASTVNLKVRNALILPSKTNVGTMIGIGGGGISANNNSSIEHSTWWVSGSASNNGEGGGQLGVINDMQGNVFTSDAAFFKSQELSPGSPSTNHCLLCDRNVASTAVTATNSSCPLCTNQGNGWTTKCTPTSSVCPAGQNDLDTLAGAPVPANFVDTTRRFATYDTAASGLHNAACSAWVVSTVYSVGDCFSSHTVGTYGNAVINYVATTAHTSAANTQPDVGSLWRTVSEYRTMADIRAGIVGGGDPITAYLAWLYVGWAATAPAYNCHGACFPGDTNAVTYMGASMPPVSACGSIQGACSIPAQGACGVIFSGCSIP